MIHVFGDAFNDMYYNGTYDPIKKRFVRDGASPRWYNGGAANVEDNVDRLKGLISSPPYCGLIRQATYERYGSYSKTSSDTNFEVFKLEPNRQPGNLDLIHVNDEDTLVISTYGHNYFDNKLVKAYFKDLLTENCHLTIIIDAKYRDIPDWFFQMAKSNNYLIWRCTGEEHSKEWAKNFHLVIHTNHDEGIYVKWSTGDLYVANIPEIEPVNTCGAGDTFTATLAWFLDVKRGDYTWIKDSCIQAIPLCIAAAQDVCMQPYTDVPRPEVIERIRNWPN